MNSSFLNVGAGDFGTINVLNGGGVSSNFGDIQDGEVTVDGARWRASGHREAQIREGDPVEVVGVSGIVLEVEPVKNSEVPAS